MKTLNTIWGMLLLALIVNAPAIALNEEQAERGFQLAFTGTAVLGDGTEVEVNFPIAYEQRGGIWHFRAGQQAIPMSSPPESYNLQLAVFEADSMVYIQEFAGNYMRSFGVSIGEYSVQLERSMGTAQYGIKVVIDDEALIFEKRTPTLSFELDETGIVDISSDGFVRDLSNRRVD